jgi:LCP family protein required for cell wall assembly
MNKKQKILRIAFLLIAVSLVCIAYLSLMARLGSLRSELERFSSGISEEVEKQHELTQRLLSNQRTVTRNLQQTRDVLNLPAGSYTFKEAETADGSAGEEAGEGSGSSDDSAFYRAVDGMARYYARKELEKELYGLIETLRSAYAEQEDTELRIREAGILRYRLENRGFRLCTLYGELGEQEQKPAVGVESYDERTHRLELEVDSGRKPDSGEVDYRIPEQAIAELRSFIDTVRENYRAQRSTFMERKQAVEALPRSKEVQREMAQKELAIRPLDVSEARARYALTDTARNERLFAFSARLGREGYQTAEEEGIALEALERRIAEQVAAYDDRDPEEIRVSEAKERVRAVAADPAFKAYLKQSGLHISTDPREDKDYFYFDLLTGEEQRFGSFAVLKKVGDIYLADREDVIISSLKRVGTESFGASGAGEEGFTLPDELPEQFSGALVGGDGATTILLCGTHKQNADTIILARMVKGKGIALLSIPRDLYYQGRKLSSFYRIYGMERFRRLVQEFTGVHIDGYLAVDMYAFIDIVDILGGITVELEQPLIDPTYKVREHGEWKTLYYAAGEHHLDGIEALRIARSRHTSDDFDRSHRQQLLLEGLRNKINALHAGKLDEIYKIFRTLSEYIDTDFSSYELAQLFLSYRNEHIERTAGISTANILHATYSNLYHQDLTKEEVSDDFDKGAWILLPVENNWNLIKWFTRKTFKDM